VQIDNSLLLYVDCDYCGSTWNRPNDTIEKPKSLTTRKQW